MVKKVDYRRKSQSGQLAVEMVMIIVLLLSLSIYASRYVRDRNLMGKLVSGPWKQISGMIETGNWQAPVNAMDEGMHPHVNTLTRIGD